MMLKLYIYGYMNRIQSSRRLEREAGRNVELMWLTGKLAPDFKTIADFRRDNAEAIKAACRRFVGLCRGFGLLGSSVVALDGSRFKAVNNRDKNFTRAKLERWLRDTDESIARYMAELDRTDREEDGASDKAERLAGRIDRLRARMARLKAIEKELEAAPDGQVSLTDPDARSMSTSAPGSGLVGYNVQAVVEPEHHLIVAHEVTNLGHDRAHLAAMAEKAKAEMAGKDLTVVADRGYFDGEEVMACEAAGVVPIVPKPDTSSAKADGRFSKNDFVYEHETDVYRCPAGERLTFRYATVEDGRTLRRYWASVCPTCPLKARCTPAPQRRISRWEHEAVLEAMRRRLEAMPGAMTMRRSTVEHAFGTLKQWMGTAPFLTRGLKNVGTEMSLSVLAYNLKRTIGIMGVAPLVAALRN